MDVDVDGFGPGHIVLVLAVILLVLGIVRALGKGGRAVGIVALVVSLRALATLALYFSINVLDDEKVSAGIGLILSLVGALVAVAAAVWATARR